MGIGISWADTVTFSLADLQSLTSSNSLTSGSITISCNSSCGWNNSKSVFQLQSSGGEITINGTDASITAITINCYKSANASTITASTGTLNTESWSKTAGSSSLSWTSEGVEEVSFTASEAHTYVDGTITVTYTAKTPVTLGVRYGSRLNTTVGAGDYHQYVTITPTEAFDASLFSIVSNTDDEVMSFTAAHYNESASTGFDLRCIPGKAGSTTVVVKYAGNTTYGSKEISITFTVNKKDQEISYATTEVTQDYTSGGTYTNELTQTTVADGNTITYASSDETVATVDESGVVTFVNAGTTTITATAAATDDYNEATASYTLTVDGEDNVTLSWMQDSHLIYTDGTAIAYGNFPYCYAVSSDERTNITYKSSDENIVKVTTEKITINNQELTACKINPVRKGEATIYANLVGSGSSNPTQVALTVTITQGTTQIAFTPTAGTINKNCTVTPNLSFPNMLADDVTSFTAVSSDESVATVTSDLKETGSVDGANYLRTVYPVITGVSAGTATITVSFESNLYENVTTTYTVTVVEGNDVNFYWTMNGSATGESKTITINEGDFIMLPAITGMSNGNNSYSDCSNKKYVYGIKKGTVEYNNRKNYKLGEGVPDISVGDETKALVFYAQGQSTAEDSLMVYGLAAGTTYLRATDPQTRNSCSDIKLVVKSGLESAHTTAVSGMYFPYTWDFSEMDLTPITTELSATGGEGASWRTYNDTYYMADGIFNADYDDKDNNGNYRQENAKIVSANGEYMKIFNGLKINLAGKDYWKQKHDRLRVAKDGSHIAFIGGRHAIVFPDPTNKPSGTYKLFIKGKGTSSSSTSNFISLTNADQTNADYQFANNKTKIVSFDASDLTNNTIYVQNMQIEWMAFSTQAKKISAVNYATYSEQYDLDFEKTKESQGVQTFAVSSTGDNKAYLTELKYAKDTQGFVIKNSDANKGTATDYYYIAKARNLDEYTDLFGCYDLNGNLVKNMLVASIGSEDISTYKSSGDVYFLSNKSYIADANGQEISGTTATYLGFFKAAIQKTHSNAFSAFLHIKPTDNVNAKYFLLSGLDDMDDVAPTSIDNSVVSDEAAGDGVYYNLNGMRVEKPGKGVYVRNGKKVIIK